MKLNLSPLTNVRKSLFGLGVVLIFAAATPIYACIHVPRTYKGTVSEKTQEALLFHDGINAHLIIKINLQAASGNLPDTMAWVIPLPSLPSHYEEANAAIFQEMFDTVEAANRKREAEEEKRSGLGPPLSIDTPASIEVHPTQIVGNYAIQPVEILDVKNAGGELNHWLIANGFGPVPIANMRYYLKKGEVFLALKIHGLRGSFSDIKPLHIVYKSDILSMPLKFSTHAGIFDVELYTFTSGALDTQLLSSENFSGDPSVEISAAADAPLLWQTAGQKHGFLTRFEGYGFNGPDVLVKNLTSDPTIDLSKNNAPIDRREPGEQPDYAVLGRIGAAILILLLGYGGWRWTRQKRPNKTSV